MKQKVKIQTYHPLYLPKGIEREIPSDAGELSEHRKQSYDYKTLFYDIFFQSNRLVCIGPPFLNIGTPLAIRYKHKGKNIRAAWDRYPKKGAIRFTMIYIDISPKNAPLELEFIFKDFTTKITVSRPNTIPLSKVDLSLVTVQKDNPLIWIKDFCIWHTRAHGIKRIVLYDNGSSYFSDLSKYLTELNEEFELVLVHWPFPFGLLEAKNDSYQDWFRMGALNHFHSFFGENTTWVISLDIDEFVYCNSPLPLFLSLPKALGQPEWLLKQRRFPAPFFFRDQKDLDQIRFYHHQIRKKQYPPVYPKYICQPRLVKSMGIHTSQRSLKLIAKAIFQSHPYVSIRLIEYLLSVVFGKAFGKIRRAIGRLIKIGRKEQLNPRQKKMPWPDHFPDEKNISLVLYHFLGLYTGWRDPNHSNKIKKPKSHLQLYPAEELVLDKRIVDKAIEIGMVTEAEIPSMDESILT